MQQQSQGPRPPARLTEAGQRVVTDLAQRHGFSASAVEAVLQAVAIGSGQQAQFNHAELGGMGQWSRGGMLMIGDMFNNALKARVGALCEDAAAQASTNDLFAQVPAPGGARWPEELGRPGAAGSQNDMRYAVFPETRRLAIEEGGEVTIYDTGDHVITGFSQQQSGRGTAGFTSQHGPVALDQLRIVSPSASTPPTTSPGSPAKPIAQDEAHDAILAKIEGLAALHAKGILSDAEFAAKKTDLLGRL